VEAIDCLHKINIIHRNINILTVLVFGDEHTANVKLTDFYYAANKQEQHPEVVQGS
jgi:serine/threonine protein kinase